MIIVLLLKMVKVKGGLSDDSFMYIHVDTTQLALMQQTTLKNVHYSCSAGVMHADMLAFIANT